MVTKFRRDNSAAWANANPVLQSGEPGWDREEHLMKIGDGVTAWNDLQPASGEIGMPGVRGATGPEGYVTRNTLTRKSKGSIAKGDVVALDELGIIRKAGPIPTEMEYNDVGELDLGSVQYSHKRINARAAVRHVSRNPENGNIALVVVYRNANSTPVRPNGLYLVEGIVGNDGKITYTEPLFLIDAFDDTYSLTHCGPGRFILLNSVGSMAVFTKVGETYTTDGWLYRQPSLGDAVQNIEYVGNDKIIVSRFSSISNGEVDIASMSPNLLLLGTLVGNTITWTPLALPLRFPLTYGWAGNSSFTFAWNELLQRLVVSNSRLNDGWDAAGGTFSAHVDLYTFDGSALTLETTQPAVVGAPGDVCFYPHIVQTAANKYVLIRINGQSHMSVAELEISGDVNKVITNLSPAGEYLLSGLAMNESYSWSINRYAATGNDEYPVVLTSGYTALMRIDPVTRVITASGDVKAPIKANSLRNGYQYDGATDQNTRIFSLIEIPDKGVFAYGGAAMYEGVLHLSLPIGNTSRVKDWIGIAATSVNAGGQSVEVAAIGHIVEGMANLMPGARYWVADDGGLSTTPTANGEIGRALSTTELKIIYLGKDDTDQPTI
jgi:hypothetical protein